MLNIRQQQWNESYARGENAIFYPHEEMVRFLNRFIRKRISQNHFSDVIYRGDFYHSGIGITKNDEIIESAKSDILTGGGANEKLLPLKALDFGCGMGRGSMLMAEFGIETQGIDISQVAVDEAKKLYTSLAQTTKLAPIKFQTYDGEQIPFDNESFDFSVSYGVLDSLPFTLAKKLVKEIERVSKTYFFVSLIGEDSTSGFSNIKEKIFTDEVEVQEAHEKGTIQSFFDYAKIQNLFSHTHFTIIWAEKKTSLNLIDNSTQSRYYIVLKKPSKE